MRERVRERECVPVSPKHCANLSHLFPCSRWHKSKTANLCRVSCRLILVLRSSSVSGMEGKEREGGMEVGGREGGRGDRREER